MRRTIYTTLLTISLTTTAFCSDTVPVPVTQQPSAAMTAEATQSTPTVPVTTPVASLSTPPSLLENKPLAVGPLAATAPVKLGYVDIQKIFQESKAGQKAFDILKKSRDKFQKQLTEKGKKLDALKKSLEAKAPQMNQLEKEAKAKEFQAKVAELQESGQKAEKEITKQAEDVRHKLQNKILKMIREYGEKNNFTVIAAEMLYSDGNHKSTDITDSVIKEIDK
jgi:outer membrane protein